MDYLKQEHVLLPKSHAPSYSIYSLSHPDGKPHGGTVVIINKTIKHHLYEECKESRKLIQSNNNSKGILSRKTSSDNDL